ncbi:glycosyltransferase [Mycolicibacterium sp.]|uniref:glycosyltransferase n=1 Tax=Mycolicibacterium sp. TaxID=2320850 RepID=UPI001A229644|nr:glycosyltransferase [Mycolicibacterium sp.]MBJ7339311.1 glycosyltransferase [Mycolicibacterium sp.]
MLTSFPPTPCGLATYSAGLADGLSAKGSDVSVVRIADGAESSSAAVVGELVGGSAESVAACADLLNERDVAVIQHAYDVYGGTEGSDVLDVIAALRVPTIVVAHEVLKHPTARQRSLMETLAAKAGRVVVMSEAANERLHAEYSVDRHKVVTIGRGATLPTVVPLKRGGRPTLLTWGLMGPGKGVERVIDAMSSLKDLRGQPRYLVAGATRPRVLAAEGEAYREACIERARSTGVATAVSFDSIYRSTASLSALIQTSAAVVLPYDSTDQANSGVLVDALAAGRPVVATAFPHAVELLGSGAGVVVSHDDPDALTFALRRMLTDPRMTGDMAAEARRLAPSLGWPVAATAFMTLAQRLLVERTALV